MIVLFLLAWESSAITGATPNKETAGCLPDQNIFHIKPYKFHNLNEFKITDLEVVKTFGKMPIWL